MLKKDVMEYFKKKKGGDGLSENKLAKLVADDIGVFPQTVNSWGYIIPKGRAFEFHVKTGGAIPLREEDYE